MNSSRRRFLKHTGWGAAGVTVLGVGGCAAIPALPTFGTSKEEEIHTWVQVMPDGRIRYYLSRAELGQGISTGLSQVVAEELNVPLNLIDCHYQSTAVMAPCQMTVGSQSIENYLDLTARAAAYLRHTLQSLAAANLGVRVDALKLVEGGFEFASGQKTTYRELVNNGGTKITSLPPNADVRLLSQRKASKLNVVGKSVEPVNIRRIVAGRETYSRDVIIKGMQYGAIARPPQIGAKMRGFNKNLALTVNGVQSVIEHGGQLGVVAKTPMAAVQGLEALDVQWQTLDAKQVAKVQRSLDIDEYLENNKLDHSPIEEGSVQSAAHNAEQTLTLRYDSPMIAHAAMEPRSGVAHWQTNEYGKSFCEIWTGCQDPWLVQAAAAKALGISKTRVVVHNQRVGGAFGGRVLCQASVEASWLSKAVGVPVKIQWTREEEFRYNYVGPQYSTRIDAGLDAKGRITHWQHRAVGAPVLTSSMFVPPYLHWIANRIADPGTKRGMAAPYTFNNQRVEFADERVPMPTGPWRGLGAAPNTFAVECAMDELAIAASEDPIEFRLKHNDNPRFAECLHRLQKHIGSSTNPIGIAAAIYKGVTFVAMAAEVSLLNGQLRVSRLICIHDCGRVISPDQVRAQIEGNLVWGIGMALHEEFTLDNAIASTTNFDRYQLPRQMDVPDMTIELIDSELPPSGAAEASIAPVAAAITNAIFSATSKRHRKLPIKVGDV